MKCTVQYTCTCIIFVYINKKVSEVIRKVAARIQNINLRDVMLKRLKKHDKFENKMNIRGQF